MNIHSLGRCLYLSLMMGVIVAAGCAPSSTGSNVGTGGAPANRSGSGGAVGPSGGTTGSGGLSSSGGSGSVNSSGGAPGSGGSVGTSSGGASQSGGSNASGGGPGSGGTVTSGGTAGTTSSGSSGGSGGGGGATGGGAGGSAANVLETVAVPVSGASAASTISLDTGELFLLKANGVVDTGTDKLDAEFGGFAATPAAAQDLVAGVDVGVDVGFKVERVPAGMTAGRKKWFGAYRADHTYFVIVTGTGAPLTVKMLRPSGTAGSGGISVAIIRLSPVPALLAAPLDSLKAPVIKQAVRSTAVTNLSTIYLLQAAGSGKVGGANLALGDADWMDWNVDGVGKLDIGDNNVDYGLGVDESNTAQSPRLRWWGPWRKDHTYYMLFAGTGNPVEFTYFDSGYGDNSPTDKLTVQMFAVP